MERLTIILPAEKAGIIQKRHAEFDCILVGIAVTSNASAKVSLVGPEAKLKELMALVGEELNAK